MFKVNYKEIYDVKVVFSYETDNNDEVSLFKGKIAEVYNDLSLENKGLIYVGLGKKDDNLKVRETIEAGFNLGKLLNARKVKSVSFDFSTVTTSLDDVLRLVYEGLLHSQYKFDYYKIKKENPTLENVSLLNLSNKKLIINEVDGLLSGVFTARDFVN